MTRRRWICALSIPVFALLVVHLVARLAWVLVPSFESYGSRYLYDSNGRAAGLPVRFDSYPYDNTSALVYSHLYAFYACACAGLVIGIIVGLRRYYSQAKTARGSAIHLVNLVTCAFTCASFFAATMSFQISDQLSLLYSLAP